jgi:hypothetical protein
LKGLHHCLSEYRYSDDDVSHGTGIDFNLIIKKILSPKSRFEELNLSPQSLPLDPSYYSLVTIASTRGCGFWKAIRSVASLSSIGNPFRTLGIQNITEVATSITDITEALEQFKVSLSEPELISLSMLLPQSPSLIHLPSLDSSEDDRNKFWSKNKKITRPAIEQYAFTLLQSYWSGYLTLNLSSTQQLEQLLQTIFVGSDLLQSILIVEYEAALKGHDGGGWTNTMEASLDAANKNCLLAMQRLRLPMFNIHNWNLEGSSNESLFSDLEYAQGTAVPSDLVKTSILILNHGIRSLYDVMKGSPLLSEVRSSVLSEEIELSEQNRWLLKLHDALLGIITYLSMVMFEYLTFLYSCSLRALLKQLSTPTPDESNSLVSIVTATSSTLLRLPRPWGGSGRYDILTEVWSAWNQIQTKASRPTIHIPQNISRWVWSEAYRRCPVLIINLDSRSDRLVSLILLDFLTSSPLHSGGTLA